MLEEECHSSVSWQNCANDYYYDILFDVLWNNELHFCVVQCENIQETISWMFLPFTKIVTDFLHRRNNKPNTDSSNSLKSLQHREVLQEWKGKEWSCLCQCFYKLSDIDSKPFFLIHLSTPILPLLSENIWLTLT